MGFWNKLFNRNNDRDDAQIKKQQEEMLRLVEMQPGLHLPNYFAQHWSIIEPTKKECIAITAEPVTDLPNRQSKFGGNPYFPVNAQYPKDENGNYMFLLAQINCSELPALDGFPNSGFIQFYITGNDGAFGCNFNDQQAQINFEVLFFEDKENVTLIEDFSFLDGVDFTCLPFDGTFKLHFTKKEEFVGMHDFQHGSKHAFEFMHDIYDHPGYSDKLSLYESQYFGSFGHKIGGYASFTQTDPRAGNERIEDYILLLQIDSQEDIYWGDSGVCNFFIHPDDLISKNFSNVFYNWDCS